MRQEKDLIDISEGVATAKNFSLKLPKKKAHRILLMRKIASSLQEQQGHFFLDQIYDVLQMAYEAETLEMNSSLIQEIEQWLSQDSLVDYLGKEGDFEAYIMKE